MTGFIKYPHLERLGGVEVEDILLGDVYAFYKIDGTNASIWYDDKNKTVRFGSRNRTLDYQNDNAGFMNNMCHHDDKLALFEKYPHLYIYGEWLVPHSLKTYRDDAWRRFYVFDVYDSITERMLPYEEYVPIVREYGFEYIPPLAILRNPYPNQIFDLLPKTGQFLVKDGEGNGEGVVLKNYNYTNKFGRQTWAKVVTNEFKEVHHKEMGAPIVLGSKFVEDAIVDKYVTEAFILKEKAKIELDRGWSNKNIPELLGRTWHEFIKEEGYNFIKEHKNPVIDFTLLNKLLIIKIKKTIGL